jgi:addiction module RelE/StbE family toxin
MKYLWSKRFKKKFKKLSPQTKRKAVCQFKIFIMKPTDRVLNNHGLSGEWEECRSINITGDLRAIYKQVSDDLCLFVEIDNHSNLYS